jgi:hypothetical protein
MLGSGTTDKYWHSLHKGNKVRIVFPPTISIYKPKDMTKKVQVKVTLRIKLAKQWKEIKITSNLAKPLN